MKTPIQKLFLKTMKPSRPNKYPGWVTAAVVSGSLLLCSTGNILAQSGSWTTIASMPHAVIGASGVAFGGKFYVIGGANGASIFTQVYDPTTHSWSLTAADPVSSALPAVGVISNKIYVAEGWIGSDANAATTALEIYDPATDSWTAGTSGLVARGDSATAVLGGKLYITGGNADFFSGDIATLEIYNPNTGTWSTGAPIPVAPEGAVGAAINGKFYVVGGGVRPAGGGAVPATANVFIYNPTTDIWTSGSPMPSPRVGAVGGVINGKLYITGGLSSNGTNNPVMVYDPVLDHWSAAAAEPTPRFLGAAAAVGGKLFVAGGYDQNGPPTATAEAFTPLPVLTIASVGNQSVLFWPAWATNYVLQGTTNLTEPNWVTASDAVPVIAITVTNTSPARFFRLQQQQ
jgi:N-acetylneuraminic acid mutarotase